jgi:hypothetical protein
VMLKPLPIGQLDVDQRDLHPSAAVNLTMHTPARLLIFEYASSLADVAAPLLVTSEPGVLPLSDSCRSV